MNYIVKKLTASRIYEYIVIRYRFQGKWKKQEEAAKADSLRLTHRKLSKLPQQSAKSVKVVTKPVQKSKLKVPPSVLNDITNAAPKIVHKIPRSKENVKQRNKNIPVNSDVIDIVRKCARKRIPKLTKTE